MGDFYNGTVYSVDFLGFSFDAILSVYCQPFFFNLSSLFRCRFIRVSLINIFMRTNT